MKAAGDGDWQPAVLPPGPVCAGSSGARMFREVRGHVGRCSVTSRTILRDSAVYPLLLF